MQIEIINLASRIIKNKNILYLEKIFPWKNKPFKQNLGYWIWFISTFLVYYWVNESSDTVISFNVLFFLHKIWITDLSSSSKQITKIHQILNPHLIQNSPVYVSLNFQQQILFYLQFSPINIYFNSLPFLLSFIGLTFWIENVDMSSCCFLSKPVVVGWSQINIILLKWRKLCPRQDCWDMLIHTKKVNEKITSLISKV